MSKGAKPRKAAFPNKRPTNRAGERRMDKDRLSKEQRADLAKDGKIKESSPKHPKIDRVKKLNKKASVARTKDAKAKKVLREMAAKKGGAKVSTTPGKAGVIKPKKGSGMEGPGANDFKSWKEWQKWEAKQWKAETKKWKEQDKK